MARAPCRTDNRNSHLQEYLSDSRTFLLGVASASASRLRFALCDRLRRQSQVKRSRSPSRSATRTARPGAGDGLRRRARLSSASAGGTPCRSSKHHAGLSVGIGLLSSAISFVLTIVLTGFEALIGAPRACICTIGGSLEAGHRDEWSGTPADSVAPGLAPMAQAASCCLGGHDGHRGDSRFRRRCAARGVHHVSRARDRECAPCRRSVGRGACARQVGQHAGRSLQAV